MMQSVDKSKNVKNQKDVFLKWLFITTLTAAIISCAVLIIQPITYPKLFSDFAEVLSYCLVKNPYDGSSGITSIYPPIAHLIFFPFLLFCRNDIQDLINGQITLHEIHTRIMFVIAYVTYVVITLFLILFVMAKMTKLKGKNLFYLIGSIILSGPIFYLFNRGNIILVSLLMALIFFWLYRSEKRWQRELSLICLALSIAIKIYPIFLVLVLLNERRWLDIVKTGLYTIILVFVPFIFISGNIFDNITSIFNSYGHFVDNTAAASSVSFIGLANILTEFCQNYLSIDVSQILFISANILKYMIIITAIITMLFCYNSTKKLSVATIAVGCFILFPDVSFGYVLTFTLIPLAIFLNSIETINKKDFIIHFVIFTIIFFTIPYIYKFCMFQNLVILIWIIIAMINLWKEFIINKKELN